MDPKASAQLDPKLQEAYNKIMGVSLNDNNAPITPATNPTPNTTPDPTAPITTSADPTITPSPTPLQPVSPPDVATLPSENSLPVIPDNTSPTQQSPQSIVEASQPTPPTEEVNVTTEPTMATVENTASIKSHAFVAKGGSMKISPAILIVGGIVFLILYTIIWIKVFNIPVPYINQ